jgi:hypothetical protein
MKYLLLFSLFLSSCGVIQTRKEFISIDSTPRGLEVYRQKEGKESIDRVGTTPMFLKVPRGAEDIYMFRDPIFEDKTINASPESICRYLREGEQFYKSKKEDTSQLVKKFVQNWTPENLLKGSSFECVNRVRTKLKNASISRKEKVCHTYLVIPPKSSYVKVSWDLAEGWRDQVFNKNKQKCDKVITPPVSEQEMIFLGIDEAVAPQDITEMEYQKFIDLAAKFKATDIVFLPFTQKNKIFSVTPKIYDVHTAKKRKTSMSEKYQVKLKVSGGYKISNTILSLFRLVPNGVAGQGRFRNRLHGDGIKDENYSNFLPSISINNIEFPQYKWKAQTRIVPHLVWEWWREDFRIDLYGLMLDLKFFWHIPLGGVIVGRAGLGGTYIFAKYDQIGYYEKMGSWVANAGLEYYFFPWKRVYILGGYRRYILPKNKINGNGWNVTGESRFFLNIGYFWPEFRTAVRRWLNW